MQIKDRFPVNEFELDELKPLFESKLLTYKKYSYYACKFGHRKEVVNKNKKAFCQTCEKNVKYKKFIESSLLVDYTKVCAFIIKTLKDFGYAISRVDKFIDVTSSGKTVRLVYEDITQDFTIFSEVYLGKAIYLVSNTTGLGRLQTICPDSILDVKEVLLEPKILRNSIDSMLCKQNFEAPLEQERKIEKLLQHISPDKFEQFTTDLLEYMRNNKGRVLKFACFMELNKCNIFGSKIIQMGKSNNADLRNPALIDCIGDIFQSANSIECKRYKVSKKTNIGNKEVQETLLHARRDGYDSILIFTTTNKVTANAWKDVLDITHKPKLTIIDLDLLKRIIFGLDAFQLIDSFSSKKT